MKTRLCCHTVSDPLTFGYLAGVILCTVGFAHAGVIEGRIQDTSSQPIRHASVVAYGCTAPSVIMRTSSTHQGRYVLKNLPAGTYQVEVMADGQARSWKSGVKVSPKGRTAEINFTLLKGGQLSGAVLTGTSRTGISNALVEAVRLEGGVSLTLSSEHGMYALSNLTPGTYSVVVSKDRFAEAQATDVRVTASTETTRNVTLFKEGLITGVVKNASGTNPIVGARVISFIDGVMRSVADTDRDGEFELSDMPPGLCQVYAAAEGYRTASNTVFVAEGAVVSNTVVALDSQ